MTTYGCLQEEVESVLDRARQNLRHETGYCDVVLRHAIKNLECLVEQFETLKDYERRAEYGDEDD